ncbi:MAG: IS66 family insertion sequence element accessory protein TnpB [Proteobacteria bacterium]|nr:IS66 family insertion sequence element accessory protein TnpB [Pseudomonadota bacterium]
MFTFAPEAEVFLHRTAVDFRKQINGLALIVQEAMMLEPMRNVSTCFGQLSKR